MRFFRWLQYMGPGWSLAEIKLLGLRDWNLEDGKPIENWNLKNTAYYEVESEPKDLAFTVFNLNIHVHSSRLKALMENLGIDCIQYLPLRIQHLDSDREVNGYYVANYLCVIDALDRQRSTYLEWGQERPDRLGEFRDVRKAVLSREKIGDARLFRLKGWEVMVVIREDVKRAIEEAGLTGSRFQEIETV